jgi:hypothetical protein
MAHYRKIKLRWEDQEDDGDWTEIASFLWSDHDPEELGWIDRQETGGFVPYVASSGEIENPVFATLEEAKADLLTRLEIIDIEDNARLQAWVNDLQAGCYVNCVYCGHRYGPSRGPDAVPVAMADVLKDHIATCPEHPLAAANARIAKLEKALEEAS